MRSFGSYLAAIIAAAPMALFAAPAAAQTNDVSYVSSTGSNANNCTRATPCRSFDGAYFKTDAGGTIRCLDSGDFGSATISKSITIDCKMEGAATPYGLAYIGTGGIQVVLRGLVADGGTDGNPAAIGVWIEAAANVVLEDCVLRDAKIATSGSGYGIRVSNSSGTAEVSIKNTVSTGNGASGLMIAPTGSGSAKVTVSNSDFTDNATGIKVDASATTGRVDVTVVDTVMDGNTNAGLAVVGGTGTTAVIATRIASSNNGKGVRVSNPTARVRLYGSDVTGNGVGIEVINGGKIFSFGDNRIIENNGNNGVAPTVIPMQ